MSVNLIAPLPIEPESVPGCDTVGILPAHDLDEALEPREVRGSLGAEVHKDVVVWNRIRVPRDEHGCFCGHAVVRHAVWHETGRWRGPEQPVDRTCRLGVGGIDQDAQILLGRLRSKATRDLQPVARVVIKIDARQSCFPARPIRNVDSNGTGRPVAPLFFPDTHAVPAMSRCAHP